MIIILNSELELNKIKDFFKSHDLTLQKIEEFKYLIKGDTFKIDEQSVKSLNGVSSVIRLTKPYHLVTRDYQKENTIIDIKGNLIGSTKQVIIAGPCSIESSEQLEKIAVELNQLGIKFLRGGAYKPRSSVYYFQGLGVEGLKYLSEISQKYNLVNVTEITSSSQIEEFIKYVDIIQVGARNMQNYELLKCLGKVNKPILLKRGPSNTIDEWLMSAEYLMANGNKEVILCERGIRTFENKTRYTLDLSVVSIIKKISHLPIIIDPSHASGDHYLIANQSLASIASNCDGLMIEVHTNPENALSDGFQSLKTSKLKDLLDKAKKISSVIDRSI